MARLREIKSIKIPLLLTKDEGEDGKDAFFLTCKPLSIYIQATTQEEAKQDFEKSIDILLNYLVANKSIIKFFKKRNLIESDSITIASSDTNIKKLKEIEPQLKAHLKKLDEIQLGNFSKAEIELEPAL